MPTVVASVIGILVTYWSWCLAMYRDVEHGLGVFESIRHVTFEGLRFPWLTVLKNMGYLSDGVSTIPLVLLVGAILWVVWNSPVQMFKTLRTRFEGMTRIRNKRSGQPMEIFGVVQSSKLNTLLPIMFLYIGPESMLPLASALAAIGGVLLIFWQRFVGLVRKLWRVIVRKQVDV